MHDASTTTMWLQATVPIAQPCMDRLRQFRCNRSVLWTYCHCPIARFLFLRQGLGRQSKYGQRGGDLGGSTTVNLALSTCTFSPPDKLADSNANIPLPLMLSMRGCKGIGWEGVWEELFVSGNGGAHRNYGDVASQQCAMVER